jgi:hypothetical protein
MPDAVLRVALLMLVPAAVYAQQPDSLDGTWIASFTIPGNRNLGGVPVRTAQVTISGENGTWLDFATAAQARDNPCLG